MSHFFNFASRFFSWLLLVILAIGLFAYFFPLPFPLQTWSYHWFLLDLSFLVLVLIGRSIFKKAS